MEESRQQPERRDEGNYAEEPAGAIRLTFAREGDGLRLVNAQRVDMVPLPTHELLGERERQSGFWLELRDQADQAVYRRIVPDPRNMWSEVFTGDRTEPFTWYRGGAASDVFVAVVPDMDTAQTLVLVGDAPEDQKDPMRRRRAGASELVRFDLRDVIDGQREAGPAEGSAE